MNAPNTPLASLKLKDANLFRNQCYIDGQWVGGAAAGAGPDDLRARAADPAFLGFLLDFLLADEAALMAFAAAEGIHPGLPMRARAALPGGDAPAWT